MLSPCRRCKLGYMSETPRTASTPCPDRETLERLIFNALPAQEAEPLAAHVFGCERCTAAAAAIAGERASERRGGRERRLIAGTQAPKKSRPWFWASVAAAGALGVIIAFEQSREPTVVELPPPRPAGTTDAPTVRAFARSGDELRELNERAVSLGTGARVRLALDGLAGFEVVALACRGTAPEVLWPRSRTPGAPSGSQRFRPADRGFLATDVTVADATMPLWLLVLAGPTAIPATTLAPACAAITAGTEARLWPASTFEWRLAVNPPR